MAYRFFPKRYIPAPDGQPYEPRHPDAVTKQFINRAEKILGLSAQRLRSSVALLPFQIAPPPSGRQFESAPR